MDIPKSGIKLNLGCGKYVLDGWVNVDAATSPQAPRPPELLCDVKSISLPDECATEVMAIHLWEHLYRWECEDVIAEWRRLSGTLLERTSGISASRLRRNEPAYAKLTCSRTTNGDPNENCQWVGVSFSRWIHVFAHWCQWGVPEKSPRRGA